MFLYSQAFFCLGITVPALMWLAAPALAAPSLGSAQAFSVLGGSTVTNVGGTTLGGNLGVAPGLAITGFPAGVVVGTVHAGDATAVQAKSDLASAYGAVASATCGANLTGTDLGGQVLSPGVYCFGAAAALTGTVVLDAQGNPDAEFTFQVGSTLTTSTNASVVLINGAQACHVFWGVGSSATLGVGSSFVGTILAQVSATVGTNASVAGRVLAQNGAVTLDANAIAAGTCSLLVSCVGAADGTPCTDGNGCTQSDLCLGGACAGSNPVVCPSGGACNLPGTCAPGSGACVFPGLPCATSGGDPHLVTFDGLFYDMMAAGEFFLVRSPSMIVQVRQEPMLVRPDLALNVAAAVQLGSDRIAVFSAPLRVLVHGVEALGSDGELTLQGGARVMRRGTLISLDGPQGSVQFAVNQAGYINIRLHVASSVLGVSGLLGNRDHRPDNDLTTRSGVTLALPVTRDQRDKVFTASWRVPAEESLFGEETQETPWRNLPQPMSAPSNPRAPPARLDPPLQASATSFEAADLPAEQRQAAQRVCASAGVVDATLLGACILDVALLDDPQAAAWVASLPVPRLVLTLVDEPNLDARRAGAVDAGPVKTDPGADAGIPAQPLALASEVGASAGCAATTAGSHRGPLGLLACTALVWTLLRRGLRAGTARRVAVKLRQRRQMR